MNREILENILTNDDVVESIRCNLDDLLRIIPEINDMIGFLHNHPHHHLDVWEHTLLALSMSENDFTIRLTLLLHDIGKPHSYQDEEVRHFRGHPLVSSKIALDILRRLEYDEEFINLVIKLIRLHDTVITDVMINDDIDFVLRLFKVQECDALAHNPSKLEKRKQYIRETNGKLLKKLSIK